jgi:hypothetical protein
MTRQSLLVLLVVKLSMKMMRVERTDLWSLLSGQRVAWSPWTYRYPQGKIHQIGGGGDNLEVKGLQYYSFHICIALVMDNATFLLTPYETYFVIDLMVRVQCEQLFLYSLLNRVRNGESKSFNCYSTM